MPAPIRFLIADDHAIFRQGLKSVFADDPDFELAGEAEDGQMLLEMLPHTPADLVLLDLRMPRLAGTDALLKIREAHPELKVLILSMYEDDQIMLHLLQSGANGYLVKNTPPPEIRHAVKTCIAQGHYFSPHLEQVLYRKAIHRPLSREDESSLLLLNARERDILKLLCSGMTAAEIGTKVFLSPRTVEGIKVQLLEKTGMKNTAALIYFAAKNGLIE